MWKMSLLMTGKRCLITWENVQDATVFWVIRLGLESSCLGSNSRSTIDQLCDIRQVCNPLCSFFLMSKKNTQPL